jgi:hypothetical protein
MNILIVSTPILNSKLHWVVCLNKRLLSNYSCPVILNLADKKVLYFSTQSNRAIKNLDEENYISDSLKEKNTTNKNTKSQYESINNDSNESSNQTLFSSKIVKKENFDSKYTSLKTSSDVNNKNTNKTNIPNDNDPYRKPPLEKILQVKEQLVHVVSCWLFILFIVFSCNCF